MASTEDQAPREAVLDAAGDAQSRIFAVGSDEGEARWWFGGLATIKATKEQTGGHYTLVEVLEPEGEGPLHVHYREDEGFWVLEGQLTFEVGEETIKAGFVRVRPQRRPPPLHRRVGSSEALVHPLARWLRGVRLRDERAGQGARPAPCARRPAQ